MIAVADIITRAGIVLNDESHVRWTVPELLAWINDAASEVVIRRPMAGAKTEALELAQGTLQTVDAIELMDVIRNLPGGRAIDRTQRYLLDSADPDWYSMTPQNQVRHFMFDDRYRTQFYVYPPVVAGTEVEVLVARAPEATSESDTLAMAREYLSSILNWVLFRALSKDDEYGNGAVAASYYQAFEAGLGRQNQTSGAVSPNGAQP